MANKFPLTVNTAINAIQELSVGDSLDLSNSGIYANGSVGTAGQLLASDGSVVYWTSPNPGDITGVTAGDGLTGGGSSGDVTVTVLANTGIVSNTSGLFVNDAYIATLSANNTTYVNSKTESNLNVNNATTATTANNSTYFDGATWAAPKAIGSGTANTGAFTTLGSGNTTITGALTANGSIITNVVAVGASTINCSLGTYFTKTATLGLTWTVTNVPASGAYSFILELTNGGTGTQTWMTGTKWPGGTAPTLAASGVDVLGFITDDGGTTWRGVHIMADSK